jgi:dihydrofolate synthase/folylpolyglutamate synthase
MTYGEALKYLDSFINYEKAPSFDYKQSLKLDRMRHLASRLGDPQKDLRCIHITGSKGKGSSSAMTAAILKEAGYRVGLYTSPHLVSFRERIRINGRMISKEELCGLVEKVRPLIERIDKKSELYPTFFEVYTALAFLYFKENKTDLCVLEVGLGGRLDATNIIEKPLCCGIAPISHEHTQKLGNTLAKIAFEKAGIIKEDSVCVSSPQAAAAMEVIKKTCAEKGCRLFKVGEDLRFKEEDPGPLICQTWLDKQSFSVSGMFGEYPRLETGLLGEHQLVNAAMVIGLVESLRFYDIIIPYNAVRDGLRGVKWPGRLQVVGQNPLVVLDGAQNRSSAAALKKSVKKFFKYDRLILILGISSDKDIKGICEELQDVSDEIILTKAGLPRAAEPISIKGHLTKEARITASVQEALGLARAIALPSDLILVTGSFFVLGEVAANGALGLTPVAA